jgi:hypothetical protein
MNLQLDRKTVSLIAESRRLWNDERAWVMNCLAVESGWTGMLPQERAAARRGCDRILAAFIEAW